MSAQPPQYRNAWSRRLLGAPLKLIAAAASLVLAGCATQNGSYQLAEPEGIDTIQLVADRSTRNQYLTDVRSDPLGAYLASREHTSRPSSDSAHPRALASTALNYLGIKYHFGGNSPAQGFDCSGLVRYAAEKSLGLKLPRRSSEMARLGESIKRNELQRGDLVFFNTRGQRFSHVGIYLGDNKFVHAPSSGSKVRVEDMTIAYWQKRYNGARRLENVDTANLASAVPAKPVTGKSAPAAKAANRPARKVTAPAKATGKARSSKVAAR